MGWGGGSSKPRLSLLIYLAVDQERIFIFLKYSTPHYIFLTSCWLEVCHIIFPSPDNGKKKKQTNKTATIGL